MNNAPTDVYNTSPWCHVQPPNENHIHATYVIFPTPVFWSVGEYTYILFSAGLASNFSQVAQVLVRWSLEFHDEADSPLIVTDCVLASRFYNSAFWLSPVSLPYDSTLGFEEKPLDFEDLSTMDLVLCSRRHRAEKCRCNSFSYFTSLHFPTLQTHIQQVMPLEDHMHPASFMQSTINQRRQEEDHPTPFNYLWTTWYVAVSSCRLFCTTFGVNTLQMVTQERTQATTTTTTRTTENSFASNQSKTTHFLSFSR